LIAQGLNAPNITELLLLFAASQASEFSARRKGLRALNSLRPCI